MKAESVCGYGILRAFVVVLFLASVAGAGRWTEFPLVLPGHHFEGISNQSLACDSAGHPYLVYGSGDMMLAWNDGTMWQWSTVDTAACQSEQTSIVIDDGGTIHIAYVAYTSADGPVLKYAHGGPWSLTSEVADSDIADESVTEGVWFPSIDVDSGGNAHIVYTADNGTWGSLKYATNTGGSWSIEELDNSVLTAGYPTIKMDASDTAHVVYVDKYSSYYDEADLVYQSGTSGSWTSEIINHGYYVYEQVYRPCLGLDSSESPHIFYCTTEYDSGMVDVLRYAYKEGGVWQEEIVDSRSSAFHPWLNVSMALDSEDRPHVCLRQYAYSENYWRYYKISHGWRASEGWVFDDVWQSSKEFGGAAISLDGSDVKHICFMDATGADLYYSYASGTTWTTEDIDQSSLLYEKSTIIADGNGDLHAMYGDVARNDFKYKCNSTGGWVTETVWGECKANYLGSNNFALDSSGYAHGYAPGWQSVYVTNSGGGWTTEPAGTSYPYNAGVAVDGSGFVHIGMDTSYYPLTYLSNASGSWESERWDQSAYTVNGDIDVAIDSTDGIHIAYGRYYNPGTGQDAADIRCASKVGSSWDIDVIDDTTGLTGGYTSMAGDANDAMHISYYNGDTYELWYATNKAGYWQKEVVDSETVAGCYSSIGVDDSGNVHIAYTDVTSGALKYAKGEAGSWDTETAATGIGNEGGYPSLTIDGDGFVYISFYEGTSESLKYVTDSVPRAAIDVSPLSLSFSAPEGGSSTKSVTVTNVGSASLTVESANLGGANPSQFSRSASLPETLLPDESMTIGVTFDPTGTGAYDASLMIESSDPDTAWVTVDLNGICYFVSDPELSLTLPKGWEGFGEVPVGSYSEVVAVKLQNTGDTTLEIDSVELSDATNFARALPECPPWPEPCNNCDFSPPFSLGVDEWCFLGVAFTPQQMGPLSTMLSVHARGIFPDTAKASVALKGTGTEPLVPQIQLLPAGYDFGILAPGQASEELVVTISNIGTAELDILGFNVYNDDGFLTDPNGGPAGVGTQFPVTIAAGGQRTFSMTFEPYDFAEYQNKVVIGSTDPDNEKVSYYFYGEGYVWNKCDFDVDDDVDFADFAILAGQWLDTDAVWPADVTPEPPDGNVNLADLRFFADNWLATRQ